MSLANYTDLQTSVAGYLHRDDLTTAIPDFITLAEAKLNRKLRLRAMEQTATGAISASVTVPTRFAEVISMRVTSAGSTYDVSYKPTSDITGETGGTYRYSIIGDNFVFDPVEAATTYTLHYYQKFAPLSDGVNWLITNAPDVYLYATLMEASPYMLDDPRIAVWGQLLAGALADLEREDRNARYGNNLRVTAG